MSSYEMKTLHDVYDGLVENETCQKTTYIMQFMWRDISWKFDVIGPYFTLGSSVEAKWPYPFVTKVMLSFHKYEFRICCLLCDGATSNLSLLKMMAGATKEQDEITSASFASPLYGRNVYLFVCPSHQVYNTYMYMCMGFL